MEPLSIEPAVVDNVVIQCSLSHHTNSIGEIHIISLATEVAKCYKYCYFKSLQEAGF